MLREDPVLRGGEPKWTLLSSQEIQTGIERGTIRFHSFRLPTTTFIKLVKRAKQAGAELTGCLNLVCALATMQAYRKYAAGSAEQKETENKLIYVLTVNPRS